MIATNEAPKILEINLSSIELPPKCLAPAPMNEHNPDWALPKREDRQQKIHMLSLITI